jgi:undecaprenyl-diphosphatase
VQGVAEVVPVSSSAQLALVPWLLGWEGPADRTTFAAGLHAGSSLGMAWALRRELTPRTLLAIGAGSVPAAVAGLLAADAVEERLGTRPQLAALLAGAGLLLWAADRRDEQHGVRRSDAVAAAVAQAAALVPGVSRSGATLIALRWRQVDRAAAQRHSLLTALPVSAGAAALTLLRADPRTLRRLAPGLLTGIPAAAVVAGLSTTGQARRGAAPVRAAALYRLGLAALVAVRHSREKS